MKRLIILLVMMLPLFAAAQSDIYADYGFINRIEPYTATVITVSDDIICLEGLTLAAADSVRSGTIEWDGTNFRGYNGAAWNNFGYLNGSGANTQLVYWTGASSVSGTSEMVYDGSSLILTDAANGPLRVRRNSAGVGNHVSILLGMHDNAAAWNTYGQIDAVILDDVAGSEDGQLRFNASEAGVITVKLGEWDHVDGLVVDQDQIYIKSISDLKISTDGTLAIFENIVNNGDIELRGYSASAGVHALYFDGTNNRIGLGTSTPGYDLDIIGITNMRSHLYVNDSVGIGTVSPDVSLDVSNAAAGGGIVRLTNSDGVLEEDQSVNELHFYQEDASGAGISNKIKTISISRTDGGGYYGNVARIGFFVSANAAGYVNDNATLEAMSIYPTSGNVGIGTTTPSEKLDVDGNLTISGTITEGTPTRIGAYIKEDSTLTTTVVTDTWKFLGGGANSKFTNIYNTSDMGFTGDTLQYTGTPTIYLHIEYGGTIKCNTAAETVHITIFINDTQAEQFYGGSYCKTSNEKYPIAGISNIVQVSTNDKIKIMIKSDSNTTITNDQFSITAHKIQ